MSKPTRKKSSRLFNIERRTFLAFSIIFIGRRDRAILNGLGGSNGICHLAVFSIFATGSGLPTQAMITKHISRQLGEGLLVLSFTGLLLGLGLYSYHVRELLVCWIFLGLVLAVPALAALGILLACFAGQYLISRIRSAATVAPEFVVYPSGLHPEVILAARILVVVNPQVAGNRHPVAAGFADHSGQLNPPAHSVAEYVPK